MKSRFYKIAAALGLAGGIAAWCFLHRNPATAPAGSPATQVASESSALQSVQPASAPGELLPLAGADFNAASSNEELLRLARRLIARSPKQALEWAESQSDPDLRERLLAMVLVAWGEVDPRAAMSWALSLDDSWRLLGVAYVLDGAVAQPELALQLGRELLVSDTTRDIGTLLVDVLSAHGKFPEALQFASEIPATARADKLVSLFHRWGENRPDEAVKALASVESKELHKTAFHALVTGWSAGNPSGLAAFAITLPAGDDRAFAFDAALSNWSLQDPAAAGAWLNEQPASPELDKAIAGLITTTDSVNRSPEVAMSWVESIADPTLRRDAMMHVMQEWAQARPDDAWKYFGAIPWLGESERDEIRKTVQKKIELANSLPESPD